MVAKRADGLSDVEFGFYNNVLRSLKETGIPFLVGGAYALARYAGVIRHTKDLDLFVQSSDWTRISAALSELNYSVELTFPHWLGKAFSGDNFIDIIFSSGSGVAAVDKLWFERATADRVLEVDVNLCPAEEMIWQKAYIMERERFDGADVAHLIKAQSENLDWQHLLMRFERDYRVLLSHLLLFGFIYPGEKNKIPAAVLNGLLERAQAESGADDASSAKLCGGTLLSREQYLIDIRDWGYKDARLKPLGELSAEDITHWTAAIDR